MRDNRDFVEFVQAWWPVVDPVDACSWLADRRRLSSEAAGLFSRHERDVLADSLAFDPPGGDLAVEDVPLIDELRYLLGEPPEAPDDEDDPLAMLDGLEDETVAELTTHDQRLVGAPTGGSARAVGSIEDDAYAHLLVDEAQDLSPMQWRMIGRRGRHASWTIVGDPAQSSWPLPEEATAARKAALRGREQSHFRLSTNYRNSREIFELAAGYARANIPDADLPHAVRETGVEPVISALTESSRVAGVREATARLADQLEGTVAVVVPAGWEPEVEGWLAPRDEARVPVLAALDTKGLEFDGIVVVEPDRIVAEAPAGIRTLYVVLTRATQRLHIVGTTSRWRSPAAAPR